MGFLNNLKYNIDLYCVCWNEMKILPFVIQYWKRFVRHAYVYDNGSDDGSVEYLKQYDWISVNTFNSDGFNDGANKDIKNTCWVGSDADYVVVCDMDECLYSKNLNDVLDRLNNEGISVAIPVWGEVCSINYPEYQDDKLCHEICGNGVYIKNDVWSHKAILFNPKKIKSMNYWYGCHTCSPEGDVNIYNFSKDEDLYICHLKNLGIEYKIDRYRTLNNRRSQFNIKNGFATHYGGSEEQIRNDFLNFINSNELTVI